MEWLGLEMLKPSFIQQLKLTLCVRSLGDLVGSG